MAKKTTKKEVKTTDAKEATPVTPANTPDTIPKNLPPEVQEKLKLIQEKLDKFKKTIVEKFDKYIVGIALLPPPRPPAPNIPPELLLEEQKKYEQEKDKYRTLVLIDDSEPTKMTKQELRDKLAAIMETTAKEIDPNIVPQTILLTELWQNCYDGKTELLQLISMSASIYDTGMLGAIRIAEIHKTMVLKKFEKYIVTYVLAGSLVQGRATKESDIDVFVVIDDTDVKKMTRVELKDKLRAIIIGMGLDAGEMTGIRNKINIQVYILTDFWDSIREANPVIFTFLRDGVPFYDRGVFMPWKQLLKMGKIKPSTEAIDIYMSSGEQMLTRVKGKLKEIGVEDFFWSILTPSQAALMLYGVPPPAPKEAPELLREIFVKKEKLLEEEYVVVLENVIKLRKDIEHGIKKEVTGKEIDQLVEDCDKYMKRLKKLFTQIEKVKEEENMIATYDTVQTVLRDVLKLEGVQKIPEGELAHIFEEELISTGKAPAKYLRTMHDLMAAKADYDAGKLGKTEIQKVRKESAEFIKYCIEHIQRKRAHSLERAKLRIKYGEKIAEIIVLGNTAYITRDISVKNAQLEQATIEHGKLTDVKKCKPEEFEEALTKKVPIVSLTPELFQSIKDIFGQYELLL